MSRYVVCYKQIQEDQIDPNPAIWEAWLEHYPFQKVQAVSAEEVIGKLILEHHNLFYIDLKRLD